MKKMQGLKPVRGETPRETGARVRDELHDARKALKDARRRPVYGGNAGMEVKALEMQVHALEAAQTKHTQHKVASGKAPAQRRKGEEIHEARRFAEALRLELLTPSAQPAPPVADLGAEKPQPQPVAA